MCRTVGGASAGPGHIHRGSPARALHELVAIERQHIATLLNELSKNSIAVEHQQRQLQQLQSTLQATITAGLDLNSPSTATAGATGANGTQRGQDGLQGGGESGVGETHSDGGRGLEKRASPSGLVFAAGATADRVDTHAAVISSARESLTASTLQQSNAGGPAGSGRRRPASAMPTAGGGGVRASAPSLHLGSPRAIAHQTTATGGHGRAAATLAAAGYGYALLNSSGPVGAYGSPGKRRPTTAGGMGIRAYINNNIKSWRDT